MRCRLRCKESMTDGQVVDSAATPDYYAVLQVHPSADQEVIEAAYRQLMKKHHPDVAGLGAGVAPRHHPAPKLTKQGPSVLADPIQRRKYDALGGGGGYGSARPRSAWSNGRSAHGATDVPP